MNCEQYGRNACYANKCKNNATCRLKNDEIDGYKCICDLNFYGNYCEIPVDPCKNLKCDYGMLNFAVLFIKIIMQA